VPSVLTPFLASLSPTPVWYRFFIGASAGRFPVPALYQPFLAGSAPSQPWYRFFGLLGA
jgi:hypothetical protein